MYSKYYLRFLITIAAAPIRTNAAPEAAAPVFGLALLSFEDLSEELDPETEEELLFTLFDELS